MEAILVIDMLNDFIKGKFKNERAQKIVGKLSNFLEKARNAKIPIIYIKDSHLPQDPELKIWGEHAMKGSWGSEIIEELKPREEDLVIEKRTYSAFFNTGLEKKLEELGIRKIYVTGILTDICVQHSVADAFFRGFEVVLVEDCCESISEEAHKNSVKYMQKIYGVKVEKSKQINFAPGGI